MTVSPRDERLTAWMRDHGPAVLAAARRVLRSGEAEDVFQEGFCRAYCRLQPFRDEGHVRAWLLRVTINECRSRLRSAWRRRVSLMGTRRGRDRGSRAGRACRRGAEATPARPGGRVALPLRGFSYRGDRRDAGRTGGYGAHPTRACSSEAETRADRRG